MDASAGVEMRSGLVTSLVSTLRRPATAGSLQIRALLLPCSPEKGGEGRQMDALCSFTKAQGCVGQTHRVRLARLPKLERAASITTDAAAAFCYGWLGEESEGSLSFRLNKRRGTGPGGVRRDRMDRMDRIDPGRRTVALSGLGTPGRVQARRARPTYRRGLEGCEMRRTKGPTQAQGREAGKGGY